MKKLFTMLVASLCGTMVYAQTGAVSVNDVTIVKGSTTQMEVTINNAKNNTAFQFDLALPAGVSVKEAKLNGEYADSRKMLDGPVTVDGKSKHRFLSYDDNNALLADGAKVIVTLAATEEAETATLTGDGIVVVTPEGSSAGKDETASAEVTAVEGVSVTIGATLVATLVSAKDLDFSNSAVTAYIATGYDYNSNNILLTRVKDVPANTPILLMSDKADTYVIPTTTSRIYYPENFLKGRATEKAPVDQTGNYKNMLYKGGKFQALDESVTEFPAGYCYLQIPASVTPAAGDALSFTMDQYGLKSYTGKYDLDFSSVTGLSAYVVTGYDKNNTIWLTRVKKVSANTPLLLVGDASTPYEVPSTEQKTSYVNMLCGDANNEIPITPETADGWKNLILLKGGYKGLPVESYNVPAGSSYLPIPKSILATARGEVAMQFNLEEAEVITMKAIFDGEDDGTTGISRVAAEAAGNDAWYNLSGQRISAPTKKGLYIKNGKKVIVK